jgi:hypothetical protein
VCSSANVCSSSSDSTDTAIYSATNTSVAHARLCTTTSDNRNHQFASQTSTITSIIVACATQTLISLHTANISVGSSIRIFGNATTAAHDISGNNENTNLTSTTNLSSTITRSDGRINDRYAQATRGQSYR